jgi:hypothetical protein
VTDDSGSRESSSSTTSHEVVDSIIAALLHSVAEAATSTRPSPPPRKKKTKRGEPRSDSDRWDQLKECGVAGWKRILARNSDSDGGWGFNFVRHGQ